MNWFKKTFADAPKMCRRLHITLLEVLIVITILATTAGLLGWGLSTAIREQRFKQEVDLLVDQIRLAQDLMLIFNSREVFLRIREAEDGTGISYKLEFDPRLFTTNPALAKELQRPHPNLKYIHYINLLGGDDNQYGTLDLHFFSGGDLMSRGILHLATAKPGSLGVIERYIALPGFPAPIVSSQENPGVEKFLLKNEEFNRRLTQGMIDEIQSQKAAKNVSSK